MLEITPFTVLLGIIFGTVLFAHIVVLVYLLQAFFVPKGRVTLTVKVLDHSGNFNHSE